MIFLSPSKKRYRNVANPKKRSQLLSPNLPRIIIVASPTSETDAALKNNFIKAKSEIRTIFSNPNVIRNRFIHSHVYRPKLRLEAEDTTISSHSKWKY